MFARAGVPNPDVRGLGTVGTGGFTQFQIFSHTLKPSVQDQIINSAAQRYNVNPNDISVRNVSSSFGNTVLDQAYLAIVFSLLIIFAYVTFRFEWRFAIPVMIALAHDIIITLGVYSVTQREVTADTVAAVLTVLGYSLYDTVIVFDRVRENIPILRNTTASKLVNESLAETITRSLNTTFVTLIPVVLLFIFGVGTLTDFAFALIVGIASGAYSSIFIAAPLLAMLLEREQTFKKRTGEPARRAARSTQATLVAEPAVTGPAVAGDSRSGRGRRLPAPAPRGRPHGAGAASTAVPAN